MVKANRRTRKRDKNTREDADQEKQKQRDDDIASVVSMSKTNPWDIRSNAFKDVEVGSAIVRERIEDFENADAQTVITSKSFKGLSIKKIDKRKIKKHLLKTKLNLIQEAKRLKAEAKKNRKKVEAEGSERQKTVVTGDMLPLLKSLPSVEDYVQKCQTMHNTCPTVQPTVQHKGRLKAKQFKRIASEDMALFKKVLEVPEFKANPGQAVKIHWDNKIALENRSHRTMDTF